MAGRRWPWVAAGLVMLAACGGGSTNELTQPRVSPARRGGSTASATSTLWGPVVAPASLVAAARAYYDGAGPAPEDVPTDRPACLLLVPTGLNETDLRLVPSSRFNVFGEYVVTWSLAQSVGTGLTLSVYPAGDPADRRFFGPAALVTALPDGSEVRRTPLQPRAVLVRITNENCEYELQPGPGLAEADDSPIVASLRLVFDP